MPTPNVEGLLASAKTTRGSVNMFVIFIAFILSAMIIDTHDKCQQKDDKFKSKTQFSYGIAVTVVVLCVLLFAYDLGIMFGYIK